MIFAPATDQRIMIKLIRAPNLLIAQHWINLLVQAHVSCELHNQYMLGAMGEIPADQCGPEIWLEHERDMEFAAQLIDGPVPQPNHTPAQWCCFSCAEWLEPQFTVCWKCGEARER
jgi:hypothetical protein